MSISQDHRYYLKLKALYYLYEQGYTQTEIAKRLNISRVTLGRLLDEAKAEGMIMLIRSMGPEVIAVDEIGSAEDVHAIEYAMHCGCKMLATVHAGSMEELRKKPLLDQMIDQGRFERYILLGNRAHVGQIDGIFDHRGSILYREDVR